MKILLIFLTSILFAWQVDFENDKIGLYTKQEWKKDFPNATGYRSSGIPQKRIYIEKNDSKILCVYFEKGLSNKGGAKWRMPIKPATDITLEYNFYFQKDFDFNKGGKLPGLGGGSAPTGGKHSKDGFSARLMWYSSGTKNSVKSPKKANLYLYLYLPGNSQKYGINIPLNTLIIPGKKYHVKIYISNQGNIKVWINDKIKTSEKFDINNIPVNQFLFHTFFGGHTKKWASPKKQKVCFDNFKISR